MARPPLSIKFFERNTAVPYPHPPLLKLGADSNQSEKKAFLFNIKVLAFLLMLGHFNLLPLKADAKILKKIGPDGALEFTNKEEGSSASGSLASRFDPLIEKIGNEKGVDPHLIRCVIKIESNFNPKAVSVANAQGLMQLLPATARLYGVTDSFDPEQNLRAGISHLKVLLKYFRDDIPLALAAYHAGLGAVTKRMEIPPIKATIDYVNAVMKLYGRAGDFRESVKRLYKKIDDQGVLIITNE